MSAIALTLNVFLGVLLLAALALGWRLERRLKALRDSHKSFTQAVDDLDRAAMRAEQGLADLRAATDEASETLAGRIAKAKSLADRLDGGLGRPATRDAPAASAAETPLRRLRDDLILEVQQESPRDRALGAFREEFASAADARADLRAPPTKPLNPARSRARIDDDLFEDGPPMRTAGLAR